MKGRAGRPQGHKRRTGGRRDRPATAQGSWLQRLLSGHPAGGLKRPCCSAWSGSRQAERKGNPREALSTGNL